MTIRALSRDYVGRVEIQQERLIIQLAQIEKSGRRQAQGANTLDVPWQKTPATRRREMLLPASVPPQQARPIRSETRATLIASIARGRRWLNELIDDAKTNVESIARRERCSVRQVNMTISLAFLAPTLVKAAIEGRLPRGMASPDCAMRPSNGLANKRCSVCRLMRPGLCQLQCPRQERVRGPQRQ